MASRQNGKRGAGWWRVGWVLAVLAGALALGTYQGNGGLAARDEKRPEGAALPADLARIPADAVLVQSVRLADLWGSPLARPVRQRLAKEEPDLPKAFEK